LQAKGLFGFVSNAISHQNCRFEVTFNQPGNREPVPAVHLKAQGKYPAETYPLYQDASGTSVCGTVRSERPCRTHAPHHPAASSAEHARTRARTCRPITLRGVSCAAFTTHHVAM